MGVYGSLWESMGVYGRESMESLWESEEIFFLRPFVKKDEGIHHLDLERDACSLFLLGPRWQEGRIFEYDWKFSTLFGGRREKGRWPQ